MSKRLLQLSKPSLTGSFKEYVEYYCNLKGWRVQQLADAARIRESDVSKTVNGKRQNVRIDYLVCICVALQISVEQSIDLATRAERAFSPASELHQAYLEIIDIYSKKPFTSEVSETWFDEADEFLRAKGLPSLPDFFAY